jgi:translation elongation factor EF-Ts
MEEVTLGYQYKDSVTGLVGTATARCEYLDGKVEVMLERVVEGKIEKDWVESSRLSHASVNDAQKS